MLPLKEIAKKAWAESDVQDMLVNIMDLAKTGSLRHADFVFKVLTYEPKQDAVQLKLSFESEPNYDKLSDEELRTIAELQSKIRISA